MGTHYQGSRGERTALDAFIKLTRAAESVGARAHATLKDRGLTVSQFGVLEALYHLGSLCQKELAGKLLKSGGNLTTVVDNLESRGLVKRQRRPGDRRFVIVQLTPAGRERITGLFPDHATRIAAEMAALTIEEQEQLGRLCRKLGLGPNGEVAAAAGKEDPS
ncbi:MAG: MarR family transcriptional regulator [Deferrisomatales bacterium]|nr:MarR family transcriptional regulator [Deferrisomatales bacterium]